MEKPHSMLDVLCWRKPPDPMEVGVTLVPACKQPTQCFGGALKLPSTFPWAFTPRQHAGTGHCLRPPLTPTSLHPPPPVNRGSGRGWGNWNS